MKKNLLIVLLLLCSIVTGGLLWHTNQTPVNTQSRSHAAQIVEPFLLNPTKANADRAIKTFTRASEHWYVQPKIASADDDTRKKLCQTLMESAHLALAAVLESDTEDEFESALDDFMSAGIDLVVWGCSAYLE